MNLSRCPPNRQQANLIALATDAMLPDHDLFDFWNALQTASMKAVDTDRAELYFQVLEELGAPSQGVKRLRSFVWEKPDEASVFVQTTMASLGLPIYFDDVGVFKSMKFKASDDRKSLHL